MNIGVRTRVGIWLLLVTSIVAIAGLALLQTTRSQLVGSAEDTLSQLAELEQRRVTAVLDEQRADVETLASDPLLINNLDSQATDSSALDLELETFLRTTAQSGQNMVAMRVVDRSGRELGRSEGVAWDQGSIELALDSMDRRSTRIGPGFQVDERDSRLSFASPIATDRGEVLGALLVEVELEPLVWLSGRYDTFGETSEAFVFQRLPNDRCELLTDLRFDRSTSFSPLEGEFGATCEELMSEGLVRGVDYRGIETITAWSEIEGADWGVAVKMDQDEVLFLLRRIQWTVGASGLAAALILLIGWFTLVRPIGTRLSRAALAANELASGNFDALINDQASDEIGVMSAGMDRLARDLAEDIERREQAEARLRIRADYDVLTGAMNRHHTTSCLQKLSSSGDPFAIVFLDLDGFKEVNDTYGHRIGDEVLCLVTARIMQATVGDDRYELGRWGGDEFVVVAPGSSKHELAELTDLISTQFDEPFRTSAGQHRVSVSIGTADNSPLDDSDEPPSVESILTAADASMYRMKRRRDGRDRVSPQAIKRVEQALEGDNIVAFLQPLVSVDVTGGVHLAGTEALVRLREDDGTFVLPDDFLPELGASEQAMAVDLKVLESAAGAVADWHRRKVVPPDFYLAVNLGAAAMSDPRLVQKVTAILDRKGLDPARLVVEIPETAQQVDATYVDALHELGVQIAIDDVGCQFSNLERLVDIQADIAKIDRRWLPDDPTGSTKLELLAGLVDQCRMLDLKIVVEGIETDAQLDLVRELGVSQVQGYLFGRPSTLLDFERLWARSGGRSLRLLADTNAVRS